MHINEMAMKVRWPLPWLGIAVCGLDFENTLALGHMNIDEQVSNMIPQQYEYIPRY